MLIAMLTAMLLTGGGSEPLFTKQQRALVRQEVVDPQRAEAVLAEMKAAQKGFQGALKRVAKLAKEWIRIDRDHEAGRQELAGVLDQIDELRASSQEEFLDHLFAMRQQMTREEWEAVFP